AEHRALIGAEPLHLEVFDDRRDRPRGEPCDVARSLLEPAPRGVELAPRAFELAARLVERSLSLALACGTDHVTARSRAFALARRFLDGGLEVALRLLERALRLLALATRAARRRERRGRRKRRKRRQLLRLLSERRQARSENAGGRDPRDAARSRPVTKMSHHVSPPLQESING